MTVSNSARTAGRPRSSEADQAILATTLRLLVEQGYDAMSIEGVAAAAGVGKTTIYRRYPSKRELVVAAVSSLAESVWPPPDSGDLRADLLAFMREMYAALAQGPGFALLGTLLVHERDDPELIALFRQRIVQPRMEIVAGLLRRGIARGEVRADAPVEVAVQMLAGAIFAHHVAGLPDDPAWLSTVLDTIWWGLATH